MKNKKGVSFAFGTFFNLVMVAIVLILVLAFILPNWTNIKKVFGSTSEQVLDLGDISLAELDKQIKNNPDGFMRSILDKCKQGGDIDERRKWCKAYIAICKDKKKPEGLGSLDKKFTEEAILQLFDKGCKPNDRAEAERQLGLLSSNKASELYDNYEGTPDNDVKKEILKELESKFPNTPEYDKAVLDSTTDANFVNKVNEIKAKYLARTPKFYRGLVEIGDFVMERAEKTDPNLKKAFYESAKDIYDKVTTRSVLVEGSDLNSLAGAYIGGLKVGSKLDEISGGNENLRKAFGDIKILRDNDKLVSDVLKTTKGGELNEEVTSLTKEGKASLIVVQGVFDGVLTEGVVGGLLVISEDDPVISMRRGGVIKFTDALATMDAVMWFKNPPKLFVINIWPIIGDEGSRIAIKCNLEYNYRDTSEMKVVSTDGGTGLAANTYCFKLGVSAKTQFPDSVGANLEFDVNWKQ